MPSLILKDIPAPLMERLRQRAARDQLSLNRQAIRLLEQALAQSGSPGPHHPTRALVPERRRPMCDHHV